MYWPFRVGGEALNPAQIGFFTYMLLTNVFSVLPGSLYGSSSSLRGILLLNFCVALLVLAAVLLTERVEARAARGDPAESSAEKRWAWRAEHPWPAAFLRTLPLPLSLLALLALSFTFPGSRLAVGVLFAVATALLVVGVRLAQNADERDTFEWRLPRSD